MFYFNKNLIILQDYFIQVPHGQSYFLGCVQIPLALFKGPCAMSSYGSFHPLQAVHPWAVTLWPGRVPTGCFAARRGRKGRCPSDGGSLRRLALLSAAAALCSRCFFSDNELSLFFLTNIWSRGETCRFPWDVRLAGELWVTRVSTSFTSRHGDDRKQSVKDL